MRTSVFLSYANNIGTFQPAHLCSVVVCCLDSIIFDPRHEKTKVLVSDLVRHKPGCTATEDG